MATTFKSVIKKDYSQFPPRFTFNNNSTLEFKSYDRPGSLWGGGYSGICLDEACLATKEIYERTILPMVADTNGVVYVISNYQKGKDYFWELAQFGKTEAAHKDGTKSWEIKSETGMAFQGINGKKKLEWFRRNLAPHIYSCQFENLPAAEENNVFRWNPLKNEQGEPQTGPISGHNYIQGLDIGKVVDPSFSVIVDCPIDTTQPAQVVWCERFPLGMGYRQQAQKAANISQFWNKCVTVADDTSSRGGAVVAKSEPFWHLFKEEFKAKDLRLKPYTWNQFSKFRVINNLALEIDEGRLFIPTPGLHPMFSELVNQICIYQYKETESFVIYSAPTGQHDDGVAALAMAVWGKCSEWAAPDSGANPIVGLY